jgi:hypothetical protein
VICLSRRNRMGFRCTQYECAYLVRRTPLERGARSVQLQRRIDGPRLVLSKSSRLRRYKHLKSRKRSV